MRTTGSERQTKIDGLDPTAIHSSLARSCRRRGVEGFTLIEMLTVIAIIGILLSIAVTAGRGIQERGRIAKAKAEMAVIAAALEQYKQQYGDYPWTPDTPPTGITNPNWDGGAVLFNALSGNLGPKANAPLATKGRTFVELARFSLTSTAAAELPDPDLPTLKVNWFSDPWGRWYYYRYREDAPETAVGDQWKSKGFLLYSHGPDGQCDIGTTATSPYGTGLLENFPSGSESINADNIYYGRD